MNGTYSTMFVVKSIHIQLIGQAMDQPIILGWFHVMQHFSVIVN